MADFYVVYIERKADSTYEEVEKAMNMALDWYRVKEDVWILFSSSNAEKWYERLKKFSGDGGFLFISRLDVSNRQGWMKKAFWEWLNKDRT